MGQRVALNGQLSVGRINENIHWYVRAAVFGYILTLVAGAQGRIKVERKFVTSDIRQWFGRDCGLDWRIDWTTARYHDYCNKPNCQRKKFIHTISLGMNLSISMMAMNLREAA